MQRFLIVLTICLFGVYHAKAKGVIDRIEPENWWVGMHLNQIQLLIHGDNIAHLDPVFVGQGIRIVNVVKMPNPNYLFVNVQIEPNALAGKRQIQFKNGKKVVESHDFWLYEREKAAEEYVGFNSSDVIYLITPDRFANGNTENDNVLGMKEIANRANIGGRHGGDIAGMKNKLDYISNMGFTAIWINPVLENNMPEYSYHGYSTTDFYKVDPRYGTNKEYKDLVASCQSKGLKVIMDMIANHCGSEHWWMNDLPADDWLNTWSEYTETNHRKITVVDPYASQRDKDVYEKGWFVKTMPDLNQKNPFLATYLIQNNIWWVEYLGISGIRMDTYSYSDATFLSNWSKTIMDEYPNFNIVGEEWFAQPTFVSYWQKDKVNHNGYTSFLPSLCDFPLEFTLMAALKEDESFGTGLIKIYELLGHDYLYAHPENLLTFPDNHDMSRVFTQLNNDLDLYKMAITFLMTTRGIPMLYYGTEILMENPGTDNHGVIRSDFPGGWRGDTIDAESGKGLNTQQKEAQAYVKQLLNWRQTSAAAKTGKLMHFEAQNGIYVYFRYTNTEKIMVIMNKNNSQTSVQLQEYAEMLEGISKGKNVLTNKTFDLNNTIEVEPRSTTVIQVY